MRQDFAEFQRAKTVGTGHLMVQGADERHVQRPFGFGAS